MLAFATEDGQGRAEALDDLGPAAVGYLGAAGQ
jgi:hypothetical protein